MHRITFKIAISCFLFISIVIYTLFLMGCAATIYGVPEEQWQKMTDAQKQAAIEGYNERERLRELERKKKAEREAYEAKIRAVEEKQQEQLRKKRIDAIYRGEAGQYGDLIRVTIQSGEMKIRGKHRSYQPVSFKIANGEVKKIEIVNNNNYYDRREEMQVVYQDGTLICDDDYYSKKPLRIVYDQGWKMGKTYTTVNTESKMKFRNVQIFIEIIPHLRKTRY